MLLLILFFKEENFLYQKHSSNDKQTRAKPGAAPQTPMLLVNSFIHPLVPKVLRGRHAQTVRDRSSHYKIDYVIVIEAKI